MLRLFAIAAILVIVAAPEGTQAGVDLGQRAFGGGPRWECTATPNTCMTCSPLTPSGSYNCIAPWVQCECQNIGLPTDFCTPVPKSLDCGVRVIYVDNACTVSQSSDMCPKKDHCFGTGNCPN